MIEFRVDGQPKPQGSKKGFVTKTGKVALVETAGKPLKDWRTTLTLSARQAATDAHWKPLEGPIGVTVTFHMPKPAKPRWWAPAVRPDLDKLTRAVLDAITTAGNIWTDDSQVTELTARKEYGTPGATIRIYPIGATP